MIKNVHKVPKKQWNKWSNQAREVFNELYGHMKDCQFAYLHPKADQPNPEHWLTTCWNAAWMAAAAVDGSIPDKIITVEAA